MSVSRLVQKLTIAGLFLAVLALPTSIQASDGIITVQPIRQYQSVEPGGLVGGLIWRGGLVLEGPPLLGGVSGIDFIDSEQFVMITDRGQFISGTLVRGEGGVPAGFEDIVFSAIQNSKGVALPRNYSRDAESVVVINRNGQPAAIRVGFENLTRVADFDLIQNRPAGAAREVLIPRWLSSLRTNQSLESVCIAPPASPIAGSTLLLPEDVANEDNNHSAWLLGRYDVGALSLKTASGFNPTDCAFLPDGDLLVLERGTGFFGFTMQLRRISASAVAPGNLMEGEVILTGSGGDIDNMEGLAVRIDVDGSTRLVLVSDDNFNDWERTLLLEFELPA